VNNKVLDYIKPGAIVPVDSTTTTMLIDALRELHQSTKEKQTRNTDEFVDVLQSVVKQNTLIVQALCLPALILKDESK
jgi:hypothetical protein